VKPKHLTKLSAIRLDVPFAAFSQTQRAISRRLANVAGATGRAGWGISQLLVSGFQT